MLASPHELLRHLCQKVVVADFVLLQDLTEHKLICLVRDAMVVVWILPWGFPQSEKMLKLSWSVLEAVLAFPRFPTVTVWEYYCRPFDLMSMWSLYVTCGVRFQ